MRLCWIRPGCDFRVFVIPPDHGSCHEAQVLQEIRKLEEIDQRLLDEVWAILFEHVPWNGPPIGCSKELRDGIWQFTFGRLPGVGFRILWFYGDRDTDLVCSSAFVKTGSTVDRVIETAIEDRARFIASGAARTLRIEEMKPRDL